MRKLTEKQYYFNLKPLLNTPKFGISFSYQTEVCVCLFVSVCLCVYARYTLLMLENQMSVFKSINILCDFWCKHKEEVGCTAYLRSQVYICIYG